MECEENEDYFSVYPNPCTGVFQIFIIQHPKSSVEVYNVLGEKVYSATMNNDRLTINLSIHPDGIYFLHLKSEKGITTEKLIMKK